MKKLVINCQTGEQEEVEMTAEEIAAIEAQQEEQPTNGEEQ